MRELPPRTRRIPPSQSSSKAQSGTTSACAENTCRIGRWQHHWWNYLRARGEYTSTKRHPLSSWELPPRTRRILEGELDSLNCKGTTSAHAENTHRGATHRRGHWNYLRARGEYRHHHHTATSHQELPPRTRRIPHLPQPCLTQLGTTSAHAENTWAWNTLGDAIRNYLRARGEYNLPW